jgi:tetratricopeptide (TPR) repeat protein
MSSVPQGLTPTESYQELTDFARRCGENSLRLAMHAAVPQTFRADLLHLLKLNFLHDAMRDPAAEADVLLAPFTEDLSGGYYQFDSEVRRQLLERLNVQHRELRGTRLERVARFLAGYIAREEEAMEAFADPLRRSFLDVQGWVALAHLDPDSAARQLANALEHTEESAGAAVRLQIGRLIRSLSAPLAVHPELLIYAAGLRSLEEGRFQEGRDMLKRLGQGDVVIAGVKMRAVDTVISEWKSRLAPQSTGTASVDLGTILIVSEADVSSWVGEPLYQYWMTAGFQPECFRMQEVWFTTEDAARGFATEKSAAFLILDERFLDLNQDRVSAIFGLPSLPVIPVWRPRLAKPGAREQYLSQRVHFRWWGTPIDFTQDKTAESLQPSVAAIRAWTTAPENVLDVALQQLDFFQQYQPKSLNGPWEHVVSGAQTLRQVAQDAINRGDLARARALLENADAALRKAVGEGAESFSIRADLAEVLTMQGDLPAARMLWEQLVDASRLINSRTLQLRALAGLGEVLAGLGEPEHAREILTRALALARELDDPRSAGIQTLLERLQPAPPEQSRAQRTGDVFFAYSNRDQSAVLNIREFLERRGVSCWDARRDIVAGTDWGNGIARAIERCRVLIVILSNAGNDSRHVAREVRRAIEMKKPILPIRVEAVKPSEALAFLAPFERLDVIDNPERELSKVYDTVQSLFGREQTQQTPPPSAPRPAPGQGQSYVSYSRLDRDRVGQLVSALESSGCSVWWDREVPSGQRWDEVLRQQLEQARYVLVVWTRNSVESEFVRDEATEALHRNILIPVLMDDVRIPLLFSRIQAALLVDWNGQTTHPEFQRLLQAISVFDKGNDRFEAVPAAPDPPRQAPGPKTKKSSLFAKIREYFRGEPPKPE